MRKSALFSLLTFVMLIMSACASGSSSEPQRAAATPQLPSKGLSAQTLNDGECGLFLWTKAEPNTLIFFSKAATAQALVKLSDTEEQVSLIATNGNIFGQFLTEQTYQGANGDRIQLSLTPGDRLEDGQRVQSGRLIVTSTEQWETIIPLLGVSACKSG